VARIVAAYGRLDEAARAGRGQKERDGTVK
jgi:hypothetical protein